METVLSSILLGYIVLAGKEDINWERIETDKDWWELHLWIGRN